LFRLTPYIFRNLFAPKATRRYPRDVRPPFEGARGELVNRIEACTFCRICEVKCPSHCISVDKKNATWTYDPFSCVFCAVCVDACPAKCLSQKLNYLAPLIEKMAVLRQGIPGQKVPTGSTGVPKTDPTSKDHKQ
jgi:ech hydrogenase subunit F